MRPGSSTRAAASARTAVSAGSQNASDLPEPVEVASATCRPDHAAPAASTWCSQGRSTPSARYPATSDASAHAGHSPWVPGRAGSSRTCRRRSSRRPPARNTSSSVALGGRRVGAGAFGTPPSLPPPAHASAEDRAARDLRPSRRAHGPSHDRGMGTRHGFRAAATAASAVGALLLTRRLTQTWGTWVGEHECVLPGDDLVPEAGAVVATRAVTVDAPPARVWPWLVQIGQGRGGFYSYDALENLVGLGIRSADTVEERWQGLAVGDEVRLADEVALRVALLEPGSHLVLLGAPERSEAAVMPFRFSWAFVVRAL